MEIGDYETKNRRAWLREPVAAPAATERGQSLIELVLLLPVLVLVLVGTIDFGRAFTAYITVTNAAREGARYGAMYPADIANIKARARNEAAGSSIVILDEDIVVTFPEGSTDPGKAIRVEVSVDVATITGPVLGSNTLRVTQGAEMVIF